MNQEREILLQKRESFQISIRKKKLEETFNQNRLILKQNYSQKSNFYTLNEQNLNQQRSEKLQNSLKRLLSQISEQGDNIWGIIVKVLRISSIQKEACTILADWPGFFIQLAQQFELNNSKVFPILPILLQSGVENLKKILKSGFFQNLAGQIQMIDNITLTYCKCISILKAIQIFINVFYPKLMPSLLLTGIINSLDFIPESFMDGPLLQEYLDYIKKITTECRPEIQRHIVLKTRTVSVLIELIKRNQNLLTLVSVKVLQQLIRLDFECQQHIQLLSIMMNVQTYLEDFTLDNQCQLEEEGYDLF